jgi:hypothetical protein
MMSNNNKDDVDYGYGDMGMDQPSSQKSEEHRPRRRGSVTKYSLESAEEVKDDYEKELNANLCKLSLKSSSGSTVSSGTDTDSDTEQIKSAPKKTRSWLGGKKK